jgi:ribosomal protein S18 acetylase RimI-like enzyme
MEHAEQLAKSAGARVMSLVVEDTNLAALHLYKRCGYHRAETRPWMAYDGLAGPQNWIRMVREI